MMVSIVRLADIAKASDNATSAISTSIYNNYQEESSKMTTSKDTQEEKFDFGDSSLSLASL